MAFMSQEHKQRIAAQLKLVIPVGWKWSLGVRHHSTLVLTIQSAPIDLVAESARVSNESRRQRGDDPSPVGTHCDVNPYWVQNQFDESLPIMRAILAAMNLDNHDRSDISTDYFDVVHYVTIHIGRWDKPFVCTLPSRLAA